MEGKWSALLFLPLLFSGLPYAMFGQAKVKASSLPVHDLNTGLTYATIQEAIDAKQTLAGDTIKVDAGTYYEQAVINKPITLAGDGNNATIIDGDGIGAPTDFGSARAIIVLEADHICIMNLTVRNAGLRNGLAAYDACIDCFRDLFGIDVESNILQSAGRGIVFGNGVSSIIINNNIISHTSGYGVDIGGWTSPTATNVTISNNVIQDAGLSGINLDGETSNCTILNNTVTDGCVGIDLAANVNTYLVPEGNLVEGNVLSNNSGANLLVEGSSHQLYPQASYTNTFRRNNLTNVEHYDFLIGGNNSATYIQDIDSSNTANNKRIYYLTNVRNAEIDPATSPDAGFLALANCTNVTAKDFNLASNSDGMLMAYSANCTLTNMTLEDNRILMTEPFSNGSYFSYFPNYGGLTLCDSTGNTIVDSAISNNTCGICLCHSDGNTFYDNAFIQNDMDAVSDRDTPFQISSITGYVSTNNWNNTLEGNYWDAYVGTDANQDGIGDTPYVIDSNNVDHSPLMGRFQNFTLLTPSAGYQSLDIISNSTVSGLTVGTWSSSPHDGIQLGEPFIQFSAAGESGTSGFCRLMIPKTVLNSSSYVVLVDSQPVNATELPNSNATCVYLYFTYSHSTHEVVVTIPEFSSLILPLFTVATLLTVAICRRKHPE
jgi:parallel beta-helix repeat protein